MKHIELTHGLVAIVDDEDFEHLNQWRWYAHKVRGRSGHYAYRLPSRKLGSRKPIHMAAYILKCEPGLMPDHINGDGLDNRRANLRMADYNQNAVNSPVSSRNTSGYKGVSWNSVKKRWKVEVTFKKNRHTYCGFLSPETAARHYDMVMRGFAGEYARLNFPDEYDGVPFSGHLDTNVVVPVETVCRVRMIGTEIETYSESLGISALAFTRMESMTKYRDAVATYFKAQV